MNPKARCGEILRIIVSPDDQGSGFQEPLTVGCLECYVHGVNAWYEAYDNTQLKKDENERGSVFRSCSKI